MKNLLKLLILLIFLCAEVFALHSPRNIQTPYTADDFWNNWNSVNPKIALFILVTPKTFWSGVAPVGFTSNTRDMTLPGHPGIVFKSSPAITPTAVEQILDEPENLEMTGIYQTGVFERRDVLAGKWNFATVEVFSASWGNVNLGELVHFSGNTGEVKDYQRYFTTEARGQLSRLSNDVGKVSSRQCRAKEFRDDECKHSSPTVTIGSHEYDIEQANVAGVRGIAADSVVFDLSLFAGELPGNYDDLEEYVLLFVNGKITCVTGENAGVSREIAAAIPEGGFPSMALYLKRLFPYPIQIGDTFNIVMGCRHILEDCVKYENAVNGRFEAFIPGIESANRIGSAN